MPGSATELPVAGSRPPGAAIPLPVPVPVPAAGRATALPKACSSVTVTWNAWAWPVSGAAAAAPADEPIDVAGIPLVYAHADGLSASATALFCTPLKSAAPVHWLDRMTIRRWSATTGVGSVTVRRFRSGAVGRGRLAG